MKAMLAGLFAVASFLVAPAAHADANPAAPAFGAVAALTAEAPAEGSPSMRSFSADAACTITWDGGGSTISWSEALNWDGDRVPGPADHVCIPAGAAGVGVGYRDETSTTVAGLESEKDLVVISGEIVVSGAATLSALMINATGAVRLDGASRIAWLDQSLGTLSGAGDLTISDRYQWSGGTHTGAGTTTVATGRLLMSGDKTLVRRLVIQGGATTSPATLDGMLYLGQDARLVNDGELVLRGSAYVRHSSSPSGPGVGRVVNNGTIETSAPSDQRIVAVPLDNHGTLRVKADSGWLLLSGGTHRGTVEIGAAGAQLLFFEGLYDFEPGSAVEAGAGSGSTKQVIVYDGALVKLRGTVNGGRFAIEGGTVQVEAPSTFSTLEVSGGLMELNGSARIEEIKQSGGHLTGTGDVTVSAYRWSSGIHSGTGTTSTDGPSASVELSGDTENERVLRGRRLVIEADGELTIGTQVTLEGGARIVNRGILKLKANINAGEGGGTVENSGRITVPPTSTSDGAFVNPRLDNNGTLEVEQGAGLLYLNGGGSHAGRFDIAARESHLGLSGVHELLPNSAIVGQPGPNAFDQLRIDGEGTDVDAAGSIDVVHLRLFKGKLKLRGSSTIEKLDQDAGSLIIEQDTSVPEVRQDGGTLGGAGSLDVTRLFTWTKGIQEGEGATVVGAGARFEALPPSGDGERSKTIVGRAVGLEGAEGVWSGGDIALSSGGELVNEGSLEIRAGAGDLVKSDAAGGLFTNRGTLDVHGDTQIEPDFDNAGGSVHIVAGTLSLFGYGNHAAGRFLVADSGSLEFAGGRHYLDESSEIRTAPEAKNGIVVRAEDDCGSWPAPPCTYVDVQGSYVAEFTDVQSGELRFAGWSTRPDLADLSISGGRVEFEVSSELVRVEQTGGELAGGGSISVLESYDWRAGSQAGWGTTSIAAGARIDIRGDAKKHLVGRGLSSAGDIIWTGANLVMHEGARLSNEGTFELRSPNATIEQGAGAQSTVYNFGLLKRPYGIAGSTTIEPDLHNYWGLAHVQQGELRLLGHGTHSAEFRISSTGRLTFAGGTHELAGNGLIATPRDGGGGAVDIEQASCRASGDPNCTVLTVRGEYAVETTNVRGGAIVFPKYAWEPKMADLVLTGGRATFDGDAEVVTVLQLDGSLNGGGEVTVLESYTWTGGTQAGPLAESAPIGTTTIAPGAVLEALQFEGNDDLKTLVERELRIEGDLDWIGGDILLSKESVLVNEGTVEMRAGDDDLIGRDGRFENSGLVKKVHADGGTITSFEGAFDNLAGGLVHLQAGSLLLHGGGDHAGGEFLVSQTGSLNFAGGHHELAAESVVQTTEVEPAGRVVFSAADACDENCTTAVVEGEWTVANTEIYGGEVLFAGAEAPVAKTLLVAGGDVAFGSDAEIGVVRQTGGALSIENDTTLTTFDSGYQLDAGELMIAARGTLDIDDQSLVVGSAGTLRGLGTVTGRVVNGGAIAPGASPGTLTIDGDYVQRAAGRLVVEAAADGGAHDELVVTGTASLEGALKVETPPGFRPPAEGVPVLRAASTGEWEDVAASASICLDYAHDTVSLVPTARAKGGPALAEAISLSRDNALFGRRAGRSLYPRVARGDDASYVAWLEEGPGVVVKRVADGGGLSPLSVLRAKPGTPQQGTNVWDVDLAAAGQHVYAVWTRPTRQPVAWESYQHEVWLAESSDGGLTFGGAEPLSPVEADGTFAWMPRLAAEGALLTVAYGNGNGELMAVSKTDGGGTFTRRVGRSRWGAYDVAVANGVSYAAWHHGEDAYVASSSDGGMSWTPPRPIGPSGLGAPRVVASGGGVHVLWLSSEVERNEAGESQHVKRLLVATSTDGGRTFATTTLGEGPAVSVDADIARDGNAVYVAWENASGVHVSKSADRGGTFSAPVQLGPPGAGVDVEASAGHVYVVWDSGPHNRRDTYLASSANGGETFHSQTQRTCRRRGLGSSILPRVVAGGDLVSLAWMEVPTTYPADFRTEVTARRGVFADPDLVVDKVAAVQAPADPTTLVEGKPTLIRAEIRSTIPDSIVAQVRYRYATETGEVTGVDDVALGPGTTKVLLPVDRTIAPSGATFELAVEVDPQNKFAEADEDNNVRDRSYPVRDTRPRRTLFIPVIMDGERTPTCADVHALRNGAMGYARMALPLAPSEVTGAAFCAAPIRLPASSLDANALHNRLDTLLNSANIEAGKTGSVRWDDVVGVVRKGWFKAWVPAQPNAVGTARPGGRSELLEAHLVAGYHYAHELAHTFTWVVPGPLEDPAKPDHMRETPSPGVRVSAREELAGPLDFMAAQAADPTVPTARWISNETFDFLLDCFDSDGCRLSYPVFGETNELGGDGGSGNDVRPEAAGTPVLAAATASLIVSGSVSADGSATLRPWYAAEMAPDVALGGGGDYRFRYVDAQGATLGETGFGVSFDEATEVSFALTIPVVVGMAKIQLVHAGSVLAERIVSATAPTVEITKPSAGDDAIVGKQLQLEWNGADADGDALTYSVALSTDGGATWLPLAETEESTFTFTPTADLTSERALVRIVATDGVNTTRTRSGVFSISARVRNGRIAYIQREFLPDVRSWAEIVWTIASDGSSPRRYGTTNPSGFSTGALSAGWSPDGASIAFGFWGTWVGAADGSGQRRVDDGLNPYYARNIYQRSIPGFGRNTGAPGCVDWSPDGRSLLLTLKAEVERAGYNGTWYDRWLPDRMWLINADGTNPREVLSTGEWGAIVGCPDWSPDGSRIAFVASLGTKGWQVVTVAPDGSDLRQVTATTSFDLMQTVAWSPDGGEIAFDRRQYMLGPYSGAQVRLWAVRVADGRLRPLTQAPIDRSGLTSYWTDTHPEWSPDGTQIAFIRYFEHREGFTPHQRFLYVQSSSDDAAEPRRLTEDLAAGYGSFTALDWQPLPPLAAPSAPPAGPTAGAGGPYSAAEGAAVQLDASASKPGGAAISTYEWDFDGDGAFDDAQGAQAELEAEDDGELRVAVRVTDAEGRSDTARASVTVRNVAPTLANADASAADDGRASLAVSLADRGLLDTHDATVDWGDGSAPQPATLVRHGAGQKVLGTHTYAQSGTFSVTVTATDDDGASATQSVDVRRRAADNAPVVEAASAATDAGSPVRLHVKGTDDEGAALTYSVASDPAHGDATVLPFASAPGDPNLAYVPARGFVGRDTFTVVASDGRLVSAPATVTIEVRSVRAIDTTPPTTTAAVSPEPNEGGWNRDDVTVTLGASDDAEGSGVREIAYRVEGATTLAETVVPGSTVTIPLTAEGDSTITFFATDNSNNREDAKTLVVRLDKTAPSIAPLPTPVPNARGWNNTGVTVSFECADDRSGVESCASPVELDGEGEHQRVTGAVADAAGNTASVDHHVSIDKTAPAIVSSRAPVANFHGWNNAAVTASFTATDELSGLDGLNIDDVVLADEGENQSATRAFTDVAGNTATATVDAINIDLTPPAVTTARTPAANEHGWNNVDVTGSFFASDGLSGLDGAAGDVVVFSTDGAAQSAKRTFADRAGNAASAEIAHVSIDKTAPTISGARSPEANANGWTNADVTVSFDCADANLLTCTDAFVVTTEGAGQVYGGRAVDLAGNVTTTAVRGISIDKTAPIVTTSRTPAANAQGWNNTAVTASFVAVDALAGIAGAASTEVVFDREGAGQSATRAFSDLAGNTTSSTLGGVNIDRTAPVLACNVAPGSLWPPNHGLIRVVATVRVTDALAGADTFELTAATSNEPDAGPGKYSNDIQGFTVGTADTEGLLRAERLGGGNGRIYTLAYRATDLAGNPGSCSALVRVQHDQGK